MHSIYDPFFMDNVMPKFHTYYRFEEGVSEADVNVVISAHIAKNYFGWLYELREKATRDVEDQSKTTLRNHLPQHVFDAAWDAMCTHWDDESFKKKFEQMKKNRNKL